MGFGKAQKQKRNSEEKRKQYREKAKAFAESLKAIEDNKSYFIEVAGRTLILPGIAIKEMYSEIHSKYVTT